jgi:hypothetical protein
MHSSYNPSVHRISRVRDLAQHVVLYWMVEIHFGSSGFGSFLLLAHAILPKCHLSEVRDILTHGLLIWMTKLYLGSSGLRDSFTHSTSAFFFPEYEIA